MDGSSNLNIASVDVILGSPLKDHIVSVLPQQHQTHSLSALDLPIQVDLTLSGLEREQLDVVVGPIDIEDSHKFKFDIDETRKYISTYHAS